MIEIASTIADAQERSSLKNSLSCFRYNIVVVSYDNSSSYDAP